MEKLDLFKGYMRSIEQCSSLLSMEVSKRGPRRVSLYVKYEDPSLGKIVSDMLDQVPVGCCEVYKEKVVITFSNKGAFKKFVKDFRYLQ